MGRIINYINPVSHLLNTSRDWLSGNPTLYLSEFAITFAISLLLTLVGFVFLKISMPHIISRIGS
jgi:ABC-type polysaccharide/polyol phosphate export permease